MRCSIIGAGAGDAALTRSPYTILVALLFHRVRLSGRSTLSILACYRVHAEKSWLCRDGGLSHVTQIHLEIPNSIEMAMHLTCVEATSSYAMPSLLDAVSNHGQE